MLCRSVIVAGYFERRNELHECPFVPIRLRTFRSTALDPNQTYRHPPATMGTMLIWQSCSNR